MSFLALVNAYTMRSVLNMAITEMVVVRAKDLRVDPDACPGVIIRPNVTHPVCNFTSANLKFLTKSKQVTLRRATCPKVLINQIPIPVVDTTTITSISTLIDDLRKIQILIG